MRIAIVGSTRYFKDMALHAEKIVKEGNQVLLPQFDSADFSELEVAEMNRSNIRQADVVHVFWDGVSMGTVFDLGMAFALFTPVKIIYLETRTFSNLFKQIAEDKS